ncbi:MAG TPA: head GIN domain-containing protein, partial [Bacteroidia bacterium]|nr:head GIN domain-containing protein [Bacteroidia bacterium]
MKTIKLAGSLMAAFLFATSSFAQTGLTFDKIRVSGPASVELRQGEVAGISIEGDNTTQNLRTISNTTEDGWLVISGSADDIVVTANKLTKIDISGSGKLESEGVFNTDEVELKVTGAGKMDLNLVAQKVKCVISGAGKIELEGSANAMQVDISGAGKIDAENFKVKTCTANISGSGKCLVDVSDELTSNISGSGSVYYITKPANLNNNVSGAGRVADANVEVKDTTRISLGSKKILIIDGDGSSVRIGFKDSVKT